MSGEDATALLPTWHGKAQSGS